MNTREREVMDARRVFVDMDGVIVDFDGYKAAHGLTGDEVKARVGAYLDMQPIPGAIEAVRSLIGMGYEVWLATKPPTGIPHAYSDKAAWVMQHLPELKRRIVITHDKGMLGGPRDFLCDDRPHKANCEKFAGTLLRFIDGYHWPEALRDLRAARDALLAEGSASSDGAEAVGPVAWRYVALPNTKPLYRSPGAWQEFIRCYKDHYEQQAATWGCRIEYAYLHPQPAQGEQESGLRDAYEGAREDLLDWKGRAQRAEARLRNLGWAGVDASETPQGEPSPRYVQWTEAGGVRVDLDSFFGSDAGKAALARFEQRSCEGLDDGEAQRASAWLAVVSVLNEVAPTWHRDSIGTGREQVCAAIRALAQRTSERRPIADEVVERACIAAAVAIDGNDPWEEFTETNKAEVRKAVRAVLEWYESAHPRGLPAGSDAQLKVLDEVIRLLESPHVMPTPTGGINYPPEHYFGLLHDFKRVRAELATAEQPSCGQDARDAARWRKAMELAVEDSTGWTIPHESGAHSLDERIDAAIAAKQRQGGDA